MTEKSVAHKVGMNSYGTADWPDGLVDWRDASPPNFDEGKTTGELRGCGYCGSMHPADVAAAIKAGASGSFADWKYGWPHKSYWDGIPNPHAGMLESRSSRTDPSPEEVAAGKWIQIPKAYLSADKGWWHEAGRPASPTTHGKFYSVHLQDASPEDRETIEQHLGLKFTFTEDGKIGWKPA